MCSWRLSETSTAVLKFVPGFVVRVRARERSVPKGCAAEEIERTERRPVEPRVSQRPHTPKGVAHKPGTDFGREVLVTRISD